MTKLFKALALSLTLTAALTACQSQTSEVTTTGQPDGANMTTEPVLPADSMTVAPADATATDSAAMPMAE